MTDKEIRLIINGQGITVSAPYLDWTLVRYLREELGLMGTKQGCDNDGTCGLCKVIINGKARFSCRTKLGKLDGAVVETIESLIL